MISDPDDVPIIASALDAKSSYLVTLDSKHFLKDPGVTLKSNPAIVTPGNFLRLLKS